MRLSWIPLVVLLNWSAVAAAQPAELLAGATPLVGATEEDVAPDLRQAELENGLRVVLDSRPGSGVVSVCSSWGVGLRDEANEELGYLRLVEQLARRPREVEAQVSARGGTTWSRVGVDRTVFCSTVPANELALAVWAESSRLTPLRVLPGELDEVRELAIDRLYPTGPAAARARGMDLLESLAFEGYWRAHRSPPANLEALTAEDLPRIERFAARYFRPDNVVMTVSGELDTTQALTVVRRLALTPRPSTPCPHYQMPEPRPRQKSERFAGLVEDRLATPHVLFGWVTPDYRTRQQRALELAAEVLAGDAASSLVQDLVVRRGLAHSVAASTTHHHGPGLLVLEVAFTPRGTMKGVELAVGQALRRLRAAGPTKAELARARARLQARLLGRLDTSRDRADLLGQIVLFEGQAKLHSELDAYQNITSEEVRQAAAAYLSDVARSIVEVHPPGWYSPVDATPVGRVHIVDSGETLSGIAARYGISLESLLKLNRIQQNKPIFPGQTLKLPREAKVVEPKATKTRSHVVKSGQTLSGIAHSYGLGTQALIRANGLNPKKPIQPGQKLVIPARAKGESSSSSPAPRQSGDDADAGKKAVPTRTHTVQKGQTLSGIAKRYGVSTAALARANGVDPKKPIRTGQKLVVPAAPPRSKPTPSSSSPPSRSPSKAAPAASKQVTHVVQKGQTLSGIAKRYGVSTAALARANGIDPKKPIRPGQKLKVPPKE